MPDFIGNSVPLGRSNTGAAVVLENDGKALNIALQGARGIEAAKARAAAAQQKSQQQRAKEYTDALKFGMETGRPFQEVYSEEVAPETITALRKNELTIKDPMALATANQRILAQTEKERLMGTKHQQYIDGYTKTALADPERDGEYVSNQFIGSTTVDGKRVRPSAYDGEVVAQRLNNDPASYVAPKVAETAFAKILPSSSESFAAGGLPGTFATTDSQKARFFKTEFRDGRYELVKGADGKPLLNLTPDNLAFLDNGRMKIVLDGKEAAEKALAEKTPGYKPKSRLALLGDLARPFASFDEKQTQDYQTVPQGRAAAKGKVAAVGFDSSPYAGDVESSSGQYDAAGKSTGGYASTFAPGVGRSLTLKGMPVPVTLAANQLTYVGGDGKPNNRYEKVNADVKVDVSERVYLMTLNGKIVGAPAANATSADSKSRLEAMIDQYKGNPAARLKLFYKGTTTDKVNTRGDGVVDSRKIIGYKSPIPGVADKDVAAGQAYLKSHPGKVLTPIYDDTTTERQTVYAPASIRGENAIIGHAKAAKADYDPQKLNEFEQAVIDRARKNGVIVEDPYTKSTPVSAKSPTPTPPTVSPSTGSSNDDAWIGKIMDFEASKGSANGTGLSNFGYNTRNPQSRQEAINYFKEDFLPKVKHFPSGVRERMGDYIYNTGRKPEDLLLLAAGKVSLADVNGTEDLSSIWQQHKASIEREMKSPAFIAKLDQARDQVYRTTKPVNGAPNPAYNASWSHRVKLFGGNSRLVIGGGRAATTTKRKVAVPLKRPLLPDGTVDYAAEAEMKMTNGDDL